MNVNGINQIFNEKIKDINSRIPDTNVTNKFKSCLENAKLKTVSDTNPETVNSDEKNATSETDTADKLLSALVTSSLASSSNSLLSSSSSSNSPFPVSNMNNSLQMLQQSALLKSLNKSIKEK